MNPIRTLLGAPIAGAGLALAAVTALPAAPAAAAAPECTNTDLAVSFHVAGAAAGSVYGQMRYRNVSGRACRTGGYGGLSFVSRHGGHQVGAPAERGPGTPVRSFVLHPGQRATSRVQIAQSADYDAAQCRPTRVAGFRVYVPDAYVSQFVRYRTTACASTAIDRFGAQLSHQALRKRG